MSGEPGCGGGCVAVLDIGKTNVKVAVVDAGRLVEVAVRRMANIARPGPPYAHYDTEAHWRFLLASLREFGAAYRIDAIAVTTHGATAALVDAAGDLVLPVLDYEDAGPDLVAAGYAGVRPDFAETGSPPLARGLNLGAQLFWQFRAFAPARTTRFILTYPQYWAMRLSEVASVEPTSLGCHTDLWRPREARFSGLVERMGWAALMPPVRAADDVLGTLRPEIARATGLAATTLVHCGIHDSNASLYPHLLRRTAPFSVVSTGTWVVAMAIGGGATALDPARDTLINVDARGDPVPSARFMGGREYEIVREGREPAYDDADIANVLARCVMLLPAVEPGSGPFRGRPSGWTAPPGSHGERFVALSWYLALMTATCLSLIEADGPTIVEGPFANNDQFLAMLSCATRRPVHAAQGSVTGTSVGAAMLATAAKAGFGRPDRASRPGDIPASSAELTSRSGEISCGSGGIPASAGEQAEVATDPDRRLAHYAAAWHSAVAKG